MAGVRPPEEYEAHSSMRSAPEEAARMAEEGVNAAISSIVDRMKFGVEVWAGHVKERWCWRKALVLVCFGDRRMHSASHVRGWCMVERGGSRYAVKTCIYLAI